jgi:hypothetical protein
MFYPQAPINNGAPYEKSTSTAQSNRFGGFNRLFDAPLPANSEKSEPLLDLSNEIHSPFNVLGPEGAGTRTRRRPFKNPHDRAQTAQTRRDNACLRCRMQRVRASLSFLCELVNHN